MNLTLDNLQKAGAFTGAPVKKDITWQQGEDTIKANVFVRRLGYSAAVEDVKSMTGKQDGIAGRIASSICDEAGNPVFTVADITGEADPERGPLDHKLTMALLAVISEVNSLGKTTASPTKTPSGTSSSSTASADAPSQKPSKT